MVLIEYSRPLVEIKRKGLNKRAGEMSNNNKNTHNMTGLFSAFLITAALSSPPATKDSFTVYLFLLEDCMITQAYTDRLTSLHSEYAGDSIGFIALFPNPVSSDSTAMAFARKYDLPFNTTRENAQNLARQFDVRVTPEVVLYNETKKIVLYQGRIDNLFERIGERRRVVTSHELAAALYSVRNHQPVPIPRTTAVGCFLNIK